VCKSGGSNDFDKAWKKLHSLQHENIVSVIECWHYSEKLHLVMDRLGVSLNGLLLSVTLSVPLSVTLAIMTDVCRGLKYLHGNIPSIVHGDLIPNNILLSANLSAKISDVGNVMISGIMPREFASKLKCENSTSLFYLPVSDLLKADVFEPSMDVFAFGKVMLHLSTQVCNLILNK